MISKEEYIKQNKWYAEILKTYSEPKFECPKCKIGGMCKRLDVVLTTYPEQYVYECNKCDHIEYLYF